MYLLHTTVLLKSSFKSNCNPRQHLMWHQKIYFYILIVLFYLQLNVAEKWKSQSLAASVVHWSTLNEGRRELQNHYIRFQPQLRGSKNKNIHLRDFKDVDFNFTHFANFKFAYFEIEVSFGLIWVNLQNGRFHLQISILGT